MRPAPLTPLPLLLAAVLSACSGGAPDPGRPAPGELPTPARPPAAPSTADAPPPGTAPADEPAAAPASPAAAAPPALERYHWRLEQAQDAHGARLQALFVAATAPLQLDFAQGRLSISHTCNRLAGGYTLEDGQLRIGRMASTRMACLEAPRMAQERAAGELLTGHFTLALAADAAPPRLTLTRSDGTRLALRGEETADSRYGGQAETVFLEVAADARPCPDPPPGATGCLQVRTLRYDAQGVRQGEPGPWQPLHDAIEGYAHEPGVRTALRVRRYARPAATAGAPAHAYVLDQVLESEQPG